MPTKKKKKKLPKLVKRIYWCGFVDDKLHHYREYTCYLDNVGHEQASLYLTKKEAKKHYVDVRKVILLETQ